MYQCRIVRQIIINMIIIGTHFSACLVDQDEKRGPPPFLVVAPIWDQ